MDWENKIIKGYRWTNPIVNRVEKAVVARQIAEKIREGQVIGVGSGSTVYLALVAVANKIREEGLAVRVIPASTEASLVCMQLGIPQTTLLEARPDWSFDGADEVDTAANLLKGRGGALFKEKLLMCSSRDNYVLVDPSKLVSRLGEYFPVPVEIFPGAMSLVEDCLYRLGASEILLRPAKGKDGAVYTENGNWILDVRFPRIEPDTEKKIKAIPGVIESGLFMGYNPHILVASGGQQ